MSTMLSTSQLAVAGSRPRSVDWIKCRSSSLSMKPFLHDKSADRCQTPRRICCG